MKEIFRVLVVDDESQIRELVEGRLARRGFEVRSADGGKAALGLLGEFDPHVVVTDLRMPDMDGFGLIGRLGGIPSIIITGHGDKESAVQAVEAGAFAYFEKPFDLDALEIMVRRAAEKRLLDLEKEQLLRKLDRLCRLQGREIESLERTNSSADFVGESARMREIKQLLSRLARKPNAGLLVLGETGTGKEVVARELHALTHPKTGTGDRTPFLAINCSAIPADLLESELFGHEKGAFSGAHAQRIGLAEAVREGTLFLDEIGELDPKHQAKILRLLQERKFKRVGANAELPFQGRIIAATHRDLLTMSKDNRFREDLYYRLSVVTVQVPALRERREDLPALVESLCARHGLTGVASARMPELNAYAWPGNIRELNNWIERAAILGMHDDEGLVTAALAGSATDGRASTGAGERRATPRFELDLSGKQPVDLKSLRNQVLDEYDRRWIEQALEANDWNVSATAKVLEIDRKNLARRMKELGITEVKEAA